MSLSIPNWSQCKSLYWTTADRVALLVPGVNKGLYWHQARSRPATRAAGCAAGENAPLPGARGSLSLEFVFEGAALPSINYGHRPLRLLSRRRTLHLGAGGSLVVVSSWQR